MVEITCDESVWRPDGEREQLTELQKTQGMSSINDNHN